MGNTETITMECPHCGGLGVIRTFAVRWFNLPCPICGGTGQGVEVARETPAESEAEAPAEPMTLRCDFCGVERPEREIACDHGDDASAYYCRAGCAEPPF